MTQAILIVDDSLAVQDAVTAALAVCAACLETVGSAEAALESLGRERPALLIVDVHLPDRSGYDLTRAAKSDHEGLPVALLVGTFEPFDQQAFESCGADVMIRKPFSAASFRQQLAGLIELEALVTVEESIEEPANEAAEDPNGQSPSDDEPRVEARPAASEALEPSADEVDRIARRVVELASERILREVAAMLPELAESVLRERLEELEKESGEDAGGEDAGEDD